MKRKIDELGRLVIPAEMRKQLNINSGDSVNIEVVDNKVVVTSSNEIDYKQKVDEAIMLCEKFMATNRDPSCNLGDLQLIIDTLKGE